MWCDYDGEWIYIILQYVPSVAEFFWRAIGGPAVVFLEVLDCTLHISGSDMRRNKDHGFFNCAAFLCASVPRILLDTGWLQHLWAWYDDGGGRRFLCTGAGAFSCFAATE